MIPIMEYIVGILYKTIVQSGIVCFLMPLLRKYIVWLWLRPGSSNYVTVDDGGSTMRMTTYDGKLYPPFGAHNFSKIKNLQMRNDDVLICGYPKTGCHWMFEIVRMLLNRTTSLSKYGKEFEGFLEALPEFVLDSLPPPRILNTHVPYKDLPKEVQMKKTKIILTTRCPKDTVVSDYNHHINLKNLFQYDGVFDNYFKLFMNGKVDYGCYFNYVTQWQHVMTSSDTPNPILLVRFEEMKTDPIETIRKVAKFLGVSISQTAAEEIARTTDFHAMKSATKKNNEGMSALYRKGIVGDWKNWLTAKQSSEIDARLEGTVR